MSHLQHNLTTLRSRTVAISGATGLVGSALIPVLEQAGVRVLRLTRRPPTDQDRELLWSPESGLKNPERLAGAAGVIHLAGESIADGRWTAAKKQRIRDSRVLGTAALARSLGMAPTPPRVLVCASAIGFYGDRGANVVDESSPPGSGFLPEVCLGWEQACEPARQAGIRVVNVRIGVILSRQGGALTKMLLPFKLGVGGKIGSGQQYMSWVSLDDVVGTILHGLIREDVQGPVNAVSPQPVTNAEFTQTLGSVLHRPTIFPMPAFAARLALGEMADDLLLASARVAPTRLQQTGYRFVFDDLRTCLSHEVG